MAEKKMTVVIDPSLEYARKLHYNERHSGWTIFRSIYWAVYLLLVGSMLYSFSQASSVNFGAFFGLSIISLALFLLVYGFSSALHLKLMKRYA